MASTASARKPPDPAAVLRARKSTAPSGVTRVITLIYHGQNRPPARGNVNHFVRSPHRSRVIATARRRPRPTARRDGLRRGHGENRSASSIAGGERSRSRTNCERQGDAAP